MSQPLEASRFPLWGSRLIEASAGTGKTWTIAALYVRLVLGHGADHAYVRPLLPPEILVMTFTRAATRELSDRIRARLLEAAQYFRQPPPQSDPFLQELLACYPEDSAREAAAWRLATAAEAMDEAAIHTIDAWCQRMLREHAFDSGNLFDEELIADENALFDTAIHDYWRQQLYPLSGADLDAALLVWGNVDGLKDTIKDLIRQEIAEESCSLGAVIGEFTRQRQQALATLKKDWDAYAEQLQDWLDAQTERKDKPFNGTKLKRAHYSNWLQSLQQWSRDPVQERPDISEAGWNRLSPEGLRDAAKDPDGTIIHVHSAALALLREELDHLPQLKPRLMQHAAGQIAARMQVLKQRSGTFGFADMLVRLDRALTANPALRERILAQYPVALIDEFQDTSPLQYRIFNAIYRTADNDAHSALLLIGDPKQSIYGFRGADIHSYLAARTATLGRHYALGTNYRSTHSMIAAVNQLFALAENPDGPYPLGAFRFRTPAGNPLPFEAVAAQGRSEIFQTSDGQQAALTIWHTAEAINAESYRSFFAEQCAARIVDLLNDAGAGFYREGQSTRLKPADIAVLVRTGQEAEAVRRALQKRQVASVYLSDQDSVFASQEAVDMQRWLLALAHPHNSRLTRAALATATLNLPLPQLLQLANDDLAWEAQVETLKRLRTIWQRQGVLTALRQWLHEFDLPARLLAQAGERSLTNILHIAELLQAASSKQDGELALIRWLSEQIAGTGDSGDEKIVRLESDADLVKVVTVHKSKGLEYPLVFLPFAGNFRKSSAGHFVSYRDENGERHIDFAPDDAAMQKVDEARLQEDLRLLYVALTRARHAVWLGLAPLTDRGAPKLHQSAIGYLLGAGSQLTPETLPQRLQALANLSDAIELVALEDPPACRGLQARAATPVLHDGAIYRGQFERNWNLASFSSLVRDLTMPASDSAQAENLREAPAEQAAPTEDAVWHSFPRGALPGNFLHEQLQWLAGEDFTLTDEVARRLVLRCERQGWGHRAEAVKTWLEVVCDTPLPVVGTALTGLTNRLPEMEFWFPSSGLDCRQLDQLCQAYLLPGQARPPLPERQLHGLLKGYMDLVFEHEGRYWILDYKSNALGRGDRDYHAAALAQATVTHRYDVQAALYMLALHRLLQSRLGDRYHPEQHLGGAICFYLRGIKNESAGCVHLPANPALLAALDASFAAKEIA